MAVLPKFGPCGVIGEFAKVFHAVSVSAYDKVRRGGEGYQPPACGVQGGPGP